MSKPGNLIVLSGPSGVGKSTLVEAVRQRHPELEFSISCTTRRPRGAEQHGREYYFLTEDDFDGRVNRGEFLEYAGVFAHRYGTLKSEVVRRLEAGRSVLLDIDVQGARQIRQAAEADPFLRRGLVSIMVMPPDLATLERRLRGRNTDSAEQLALRLKQAEKELSHYPEYDYCLVNADLAVAVEDFSAILRSSRCRSSLLDAKEYLS